MPCFLSVGGVCSLQSPERSCGLVTHDDWPRVTVPRSYGAAEIGLTIFFSVLFSFHPKHFYHRRFSHLSSAHWC